MKERKYRINIKEVAAEYQELAAVMNWADSLYLPRIFKIAFTPEQAGIALEFTISPEEIASILGISPDEVESNAQRCQVEAIAVKLGLEKEAVEKHIRYMFELGYAFPTRRGWRWARDAMQLRDSQTNTKYDEQLGDEYFDLWKAFERVEMYPAASPLTAGAAAEIEPSFRIIPARKSLGDIPDVIPEESVEQILKRAATVAVIHCPCKRLVRDRDPDMPTEVCIICDRVAEHNIRRGTARVISLDEALAIHDAATDAGLVCMPQSNEAWPKAVCHCHRSSCGVLTPAVLLHYPFQTTVAPSPYKARTDTDKCTGCRKCQSVCQFEAIQIENTSGADQSPRARVDPAKCLGCGLCVSVCPEGARTMSTV